MTEPRTELWPRLTRYYLAFETGAAVVWWPLLFAVPGSRALFWPVEQFSKSGLLAFLPADAVFFLPVSLAAIWGLARGKAWACHLLWLRAGAIAYAALYCVGITVQSGGAAWLSPVLMSLSAGANLFLAAATGVGPNADKE